MLSHMPTLAQRFNTAVPARADRLADLPIAPGTRADYHALRPHHYRPGHPATMTRMLAIRDPRPTASDRYTRRESRPRAVAVLVESLPALSCRARDAALAGRYRHLPPKPRAALLNDELRCISRVIVDPRYRGLGLAVRLVRRALGTATTRYTEAIAVMGRVSPFFRRAGMAEYKRPPLEASQRLAAALAHVHIDPVQLTLPDHVAQQIGALPADKQRWIQQELWRWVRSAGGRSARQPPALRDMLDTARQRLTAQPIYYLHENTDARPVDTDTQSPGHLPAQPACAADPDRPAR